MSRYPYPVYRDHDYYYTVCRDGKRYALAAVPASPQLRGVSCLISLEGARSRAGSLCRLEVMAAEHHLTGVRNPPALLRAATEGRSKKPTTIIPAGGGDVKREA